MYAYAWICATFGWMYTRMALTAKEALLHFKEFLLIQAGRKRGQATDISEDSLCFTREEYVAGQLDSFQVA